eukprot:TRINITY_DN492_c0_g1_i2.p2 TRINITY_DN492_c0_g1~~TRINITY_DN492_c0_g1_i2.p2  ORF type:complete len:255 (-),score=-38.18 TRINITY_DN492_c0_g1_i2:49-813(-)
MHSCCHVCHVSMRQRPRPSKGCSTCKSILCNICLTERFPTNLWEEADSTPNWQCPKCTGTCVCKACRTKSRSSTPTTTSTPEWEPAQEGAFQVVEKKRKPKKKKRKRREPELLRPQSAPARGPSPPVFHDSYNMRTPALKKGRGEQQRPVPMMGLGSLLYDTQAPTHLKILELQRAKESCQSTITEMKQLLSLMELEEKEIDSALQGLITEATKSPQPKSGLLKPMPKSASACSLEDLEQNAMKMESQLPTAGH